MRGSKGPRELLLMLLHSRYMRVVTHPLFTIPMFIASLYALYFTPLFDFLMGSAVGHAVMMVHFLAVGLVFFWPIMGVDPGPHRPGHLMRMLELFAGMPFHAFFGIALMMASTPMVTTFQDPPASLGIDTLSDQNAAGGIAWAFSEVPSVLVLIALLFQWYASDQRQARRRTAPPTGTATRSWRRTTPTWPPSTRAVRVFRLDQAREPGLIRTEGPGSRTRLDPGNRGTMEGPNQEEGVAMPGTTNGSTSIKTMGVITVGALVAVTAYTVALGSNGWLWFGWVVLGLITLGMVATRSA